jgi:predicted phosphohydrolase
MFEQLFGSKTRVKLIRIFLDNPDKLFYVRELTRLSNSMINSIRRELDNLINLKIIIAQPPSIKKTKGTVDPPKINAKKFYRLNPNNVLQKDLQSLFSKGKVLIEKKLVERIKRMGDIKYLSLGGLFTDDERAVSDLFIVGDFDKKKMLVVLSKIEKELERDLNYTIMQEDEFKLRSDISDRFLLDIMENEKNMVFVDRLVKSQKQIQNNDLLDYPSDDEQIEIYENKEQSEQTQSEQL